MYEALSCREILAFDLTLFGSETRSLIGNLIKRDLNETKKKCFPLRIRPGWIH